MKAQIRLKNIVVEVEGESQKALFSALAQTHEVFGETCCGLCKSENIRPVVRRVASGKKTFDYYEWHCCNPKCRAKLSFGQNNEGDTLFPKRRLLENGQPDMTDGKYGDHNGWTKFKGEAKE